MAEGLKRRLPAVVFNGDLDREDRLYTVLNVKFPEHPTGAWPCFADLEGGLLGRQRSAEPMGSHVYAPWAFDPNRASIRFSFSRYTSEADIDMALDAVERVLLLQK